MIINRTPVLATFKQLQYIDQLVIDLQFNIHRRNAHIASVIERPFPGMDRITKSEASAIINKFKEWKAGIQEWKENNNAKITESAETDECF